jgi:hypothetical protein
VVYGLDRVADPNRIDIRSLKSEDAISIDRLPGHVRPRFALDQDVIDAEIFVAISPNICRLFIPSRFRFQRFAARPVETEGLGIAGDLDRFHPGGVAFAVFIERLFVHPGEAVTTRARGAPDGPLEVTTCEDTREPAAVRVVIHQPGRRRRRFHLDFLLDHNIETWKIFYVLNYVLL